MRQASTPRSSPGCSALPAALLAAVVVYLACLAWLPSLERRLDPLTGDEPFYVMTSISLVEDHDLNEQNNYDQRDYDRFYPAFGPTRDGWPSYPDPLPPPPRRLPLLPGPPPAPPIPHQTVRSLQQTRSGSGAPDRRAVRDRRPHADAGRSRRHRRRRGS